MTFYQTTSALFIGLLVATLLRIDLISARVQAVRHHDERVRRLAALLVIVALSMTIGELLSIVVLYRHEATSIEHAIVGVTALIAITGTIGPGILVELRRLLGHTAVDHTIRAATIGATVMAGLFVLLVAFFSGSIATGPAKLGPPNTPRWFTVYGTCASGACGLNERAAPTPQSTRLDELQDGSAVGVICQTEGATLRAGGHVSAVWDRLRTGAYVSDLFVSTPGVGRLSGNLPRCSSAPIAGTSRG